MNQESVCIAPAPQPIWLKLFVLGVFYACLLLPVGQMAYLHANWMKVGLLGAVFLLLGALSMRARAGRIWQEPQFMITMLFVAYLIHQFEEHGIDLLGRPFHFMVDGNAALGPLIGCTFSPCPFTTEIIYFVNIISVWGVMAASLVLDDPRWLFGRLCSAALLISNAFAHIVSGITHREYNSGLLTALLLFVPMALYFYREIQRQYNVQRHWILLSIGWGIACHGILLLFAWLMFVRHQLPESLYPVPLAMWAAVPFLVNLRHLTEGRKAQ